MERKKRILGVIIFSLGILSLARTTFLAYNSFLLDFSVYYHAASLALRGMSPYLVDSVTHLQFIYPPTSIFFIYPIALFPFALSSQIWTSLSVSSFVGSLIILNKFHKVTFIENSLIFTLGVFSFPFKFTVGMGQINLILLFFISLFFYFVVKQKLVISAILLMVVSSIKVFPILFLLPIIIKRKLKLMVLTLIAILVIWVAAFLYFSEVNVYYLRSILFNQLNSNAGDVYYNQSVNALLLRFSIGEVFQNIIKLVLLVVVSWYTSSKKLNLINSLLLFTTTILLISNITWQHHLIFLLIPFYFLIGKVKSTAYLVLLTLSYVLVAINIPNSTSYTDKVFGNIVLSHGTLGMLLLLFIQFKHYAKK